MFDRFARQQILTVPDIPKGIAQVDSGSLG